MAIDGIAAIECGIDTSMTFIILLSGKPRKWLMRQAALAATSETAPGARPARTRPALREEEAPR
jgi:hypothetical protein